MYSRTGKKTITDQNKTAKTYRSGSLPQLLSYFKVRVQLRH